MRGGKGGLGVVMLNSKRKGSTAEREIVAIFSEAGFPAHRNDQRYVGGRNNPDISCKGLEWAHIECKRTERLNLDAAMLQADRDCAGRVPLVASRKNRRPWLVTMHLTDFLKLVKATHADREMEELS